MTFYHSGKMGDVIYSLPTIRAMGGGILYLPENGPEVTGMYSFMKSLLEMQSYIHEVRQAPDSVFYDDSREWVDVDLNLHRTHPQRGKVNMVQRYFDVFGISQPVPLQWIDVKSTWNTPYTLINLTDRFRNRSRVSWKHVFNRISGEARFIGTQDEADKFIRKYGPIGVFMADNALDVADIVNSASAIYCNQSFVLTLAQAMNKTRYVEFKPGKTNCHFNSPNEHAL